MVHLKQLLIKKHLPEEEVKLGCSEFSSPTCKDMFLFGVFTALFCVFCVVIDKFIIDVVTVLRVVDTKGCVVFSESSKTFSILRSLHPKRILKR